MQTASRWLGIPNDITLWELLNSELIAAIIIGFFGLFLGRKDNRLTERAEDSATAAAYERELEELGVPEAPAGDARRAGPPVQAPPRESAPPGAGGSDAATGREEKEKTAASPGAGNPLQSKASHLVNSAKKLVDERLAAQSDGRKRRRYENIGRRDYRLRVLAARDDGLISNTKALHLLAIFETWRPYGTGRRAVTEEVMERLEHHLEGARAGSG